ncbi:baseplate J/gp47 family protein [Flavobacterium sp. DGU11]|uniref:Baseplate J/gp47 family protein n=1 Tax=Flavobacterium arundinis TaxID=3139143 RepID=A0ABU9HSB1_9FLAO
MKITNNGLSREERQARSIINKPFSVIDNNEVSLFEQARKIAGFLHYYNVDGTREGYFDEILTDLSEPEKIYGQTPGTHSGGYMEPSQALLLIFIENLHHTTAQFNEKWKEYPVWYMESILKAKPLPMKGNKVWLSFSKKPFENVTVKEDTRFVTVNKEDKPLYYKLKEDIELLDTVVEKAYMLSLEKDRNRYPESHFDFVTGLRLQEVIAGQAGPKATPKLRTIGVKLTSPALLLREGKRSVNITFYSQNKWEDIVKQGMDAFLKVHPETLLMSHEEMFKTIISEFTRDMFFLTISTTEGWTKVESYSVTPGEEDSLILDFTLPESFPATTGCTFEKHGFSCKYPKLNIHLNFDAWLYPYSWIRHFLIVKVSIASSARGITGLQVYNELGQVDVSKPFPPFGIHNEKGAWLAIGNYEMAIKNTKSVDVDIQWRQLPEDEKGLQGYYSEYNKGIDNTSFRLRSAFLADHNWKETPERSEYYLFSSVGKPQGEMPVPDNLLANHTLLHGIDVSKMPPVGIDEKDYSYVPMARSGYLNFVLVSPDIGFGEADHRRLFAEQLMKNARKDQKYPTINSPMTPLVERITLNYRSEDMIDLLEKSDNNSVVDSILPLDTLRTFPENENKPIPFAVEIEESNLLLALRDVVPGKVLNLYFSFIPSLEEVAESNIPGIRWYIGNSRNWKLMPHSFVQKDETRRLSVEGRIQFLMPESIAPSLFDNDGLLWIRAGLVMMGKTIIPKLKDIYTNAALLCLDIDLNSNEKVPFKHITAPLEPEKNIPGVTSFSRISTFHEGREAEDPKDMLMRISEHITHQGRAVTLRDYERITLQAFHDIARVKCYRGSSDTEDTSVFVAVLPFSRSEMPLVSNYVMVNIQRYLRKLSSAYVANIRVINPVYQEILVRAVLKFNGEYLSESRRKLLIQKIDEVIAPWLEKGEIPSFGHAVAVKKLHNAITKEFKQDIEITDLEVLRFEKEGDKYVINACTDIDDLIKPSQPNVIFVPAKEHFIYIDGHDVNMIDDFGIDEMTLGDTFIIK